MNPNYWGRTHAERTGTVAACIKDLNGYEQRGYTPMVSIANSAWGLGRSIVTLTTQSGSQNFLGAPWVEGLVGNAPERMRPRLALMLLSLSPHYFYSVDIRAEHERNRCSRQMLAESLIAPHVDAATTVLDYGCGPGYMAASVAEKVGHVYAIDISGGVLACARALNNRPNISYCRPADFERSPAQVDLAYSFAVVQHLGTDALEQVLGLIAEKIRPGGLLLLHFAVPQTGGYRTEMDWADDRSLLGRAKLRYGLHCFGRAPEEMVSVAGRSGFTDIRVSSLTNITTVSIDDDVRNQHWLVARRKKSM